MKEWHSTDMNRKYIFSALIATMMAISANAQGQFNEMEYGKTQTVFHLNASSTPKLRLYKSCLLYTSDAADDA